VIYICVPAHDEGQTVGVVLWKLRQVMAEAARDYQILVADDASTDRTAEVLEPYTRVLPLTVMRSARRRGYSASLEMLLREAVHRSEYPRRDVVVVMQADFTEEPDHIVTLLKRIESGADIVASNPRPQAKPGLRERASRSLCRLLLRRSSWPEGVQDPLTGFLAYRVSTLRKAFEETGGGRLLRHEGAVANAGLLRAAAPHARRVDCVDWQPRPERRQRESRTDPGSRLRAVWSFARNRESPDLIPVAELAPAVIRTARSPDHVPSVESLRGAGVTRFGEAEAPPRRGARGSRGGRNGKATNGVREGGGGGTGETASRGQRPRRDSLEAAPAKRERRPRQAADPAPADAAPAPSEPVDAAPARDKPRRPRRPRKRANGAPTVVAGSEAEPAAGEAPATVEPGDDAPARPKRKRSRGGRKRTAEATTEPAPGLQPVGAPAEQSDAGPAAGDAAGDAAESAEKPRRRRGRRGGRRRSGRRAAENGGNGNAESPSASPEVGGDSSPD
jgi:hypothetical protein